ncbi:hypothetical protein [Streptomyces sp. ID05-47C]|uniref:hypothetical protein n=1 Tax=Streptomyces sp. ID05-47C TaxID=3028665 RepID=UPI0029B69575|nr:hypothetical protein [Streptomyces sp. ID05-47C]MDX3569474.1 hypothetical protein [Streptomyces sp. ID05-47C]
MHSRAVDPAQVAAYAVQSSPEAWGALLVLARLHRAGRAPEPLDVHHDQGQTGAMVRTYVLPPEERQQVLRSGGFMAVGQ